MREIKFRAWSELNKHMYPQTGATFEISADGKIAHTYGIYQQKLVLMQYIGRKDKNGTEIYKSDLVEYPETSFPLEVVWDDFSCGFMLRNANGVLSKIPSEEAMAKYGLKIGNIYENKELLGEKL